MFPAWTPRWSGRRDCRPPPTAPSRCVLRRPVSRGRRCWTEAPAWRGCSCTDPAGEPTVSMAGLERAYREEWTTVVAALARRLGDLQAAEDAAAEAFAAAARAWARDGVPPNPGGWLTVTALRKAVDQLRRDRPVAIDPHVLAEVTRGTSEEDEEMAAGRLVDDRLGLVFACCHPALALEVRVAMTLRYVAGLTTREISAAFLLSEPTLAQRLGRAEREIREAGDRL